MGRNKVKCHAHASKADKIHTCRQLLTKNKNILIISDERLVCGPWHGATFYLIETVMNDLPFLHPNLYWLIRFNHRNSKLTPAQLLR